MHEPDPFHATCDAVHDYGESCRRSGFLRGLAVAEKIERWLSSDTVTIAEVRKWADSAIRIVKEQEGIK